MSSLHPEVLTWTALLGRWMDFARASVAMPKDAEGDRWRECVPAVINLQAVTFALAELTSLATEERPLARDRAEMIIRENVEKIRTTYRSAGVPIEDSLAEICTDARAALEASAWAGAVELVWEGPGTMVVPSLPDVSELITPDVGGAAVMQPGTIVMPGEPVAWWVDREGGAMAAAFSSCQGATEQPCEGEPRQVYRQVDDEGRIVRDVMAPVTAEPVPGLPLLVPLLDSGRPIGHFTLDAAEWEARQRAAMTGQTIPVEVVGVDD